MQDEKKELEVLGETVKKSLKGKIGLTLPYAIQVGINAICKGVIKKNDVIVLTTYVDGQFTIWMYPLTANLEIVQNLLMTSLTQVKNTYMSQKLTEEKEKAKRLQKQYIG